MKKRYFVYLISIMVLAGLLLAGCSEPSPPVGGGDDKDVL